LTFILDMRKNQDIMYVKINDTTLPYAIGDISHRKKRIQVILADMESIYIISTTFLENLPIDKNKEYEFYSSITGDLMSFQ
jgi:hypothetical protein